MSDSPDDIWRNALNSAIKIVAVREHSTLELTQKLKHRGYPDEVIQSVITDCRQRGYLDDRRAADQMLHSMKRKGFGSLRIRNELHKRGLPGGLSELDPAEESCVALRAALKKRPALQRETEPCKRRLRLIRFLKSRGFSEGAILEVLKTIEE
jgi:regulatory protein